MRKVCEKRIVLKSFKFTVAEWYAATQNECPQLKADGLKSWTSNKMDELKVVHKKKLPAASKCRAMKNVGIKHLVKVEK